VLDADGLATGELYEMDAMEAARSALPQPDFDQQIAILKEGLRLSASYGITSVHNMDGDVEQTALYGWLEEHDELTLRIYMPFWVKPEMELATMQEQATILRTRYNSEMLHGSMNPIRPFRSTALQIGLMSMANRSGLPNALPNLSPKPTAWDVKSRSMLWVMGLFDGS